MKNRLLTGFAIAGIAVVGAGCGGGSSKGASGTGTTSAASAKAAFVTRLDDLCTRADAAFSAAHNVQGEESVVSHYVTQFSALKPPAALSSIYARYLTVLGKELTALKQGNENQLFKLAHNQAKPLVKQMGAFGCVTGS